MRVEHPETAIVPYLTGDLASPEREQVAEHVGSCAECRRVADAFRATLDGLAASRPEPPPLHRGPYRVELREKLDRRLGRRERTAAWRWWRPIPVALSAALVGVLVYLAVGTNLHPPRVAELSPTAELSSVEETLIGGRLELLRQYSLLEQLELLEDLDVIRNLDRLPAVREG